MELPSFYRTFFYILLPWRKESAGFLGRYSLSTVFFIGIMATNHVFSATTHGLLQLKQEVASFLANEYSNAAYERVEINVGNLDQRLKIGTCNQPLHMRAQDNSGLGGNITVNVECTSGRRWSIHVPAQVYIFSAIPVAARPLTRGELVSAADITVDTVNISLIRQEFLSATELAVGKEVKRNINQGEPLRSALLDAPRAIKRGDLVELASVAGSIRVITSGTAMSDGRIGQKIRVRNTQSTRVVSARVMAPGQVETE